MIEASIARRYARALLAVATEDDRVEKVGEELAAAAASLRASPELRDVLFNPRFGHAQRQRALDEIVPVLKLSPTVAKLLSLLSARRRLDALDALEREYRALADERAGRVRARVISALALSASELGEIAAALERATRRTVVLESATDASLLGGVVAQVGSVVYDGSLKTQLEQFRVRLKAGSA